MTQEPNTVPPEPAVDAGLNGQADQPDAAPSGNADATLPRRKDKGRLLFAAGGLGVGLVAGVLLGQIDFPATSQAIPDAVESCEVATAVGINLLDEGQSISMQTAGSESTGAEYAEVTCVLIALETPQSVISRIDSTRALDGRQTGEWGEFSASWGYHPDSGLDIVVETVDKK